MFPNLTRISLLMKWFATIGSGLYTLLAIFMWFKHAADARRWNSSMEESWKDVWLPLFESLAYAAVAYLVLMAISESIKVLLAIETNTRNGAPAELVTDADLVPPP